MSSTSRSGSSGFGPGPTICKDPVEFFSRSQLSHGVGGSQTVASLRNSQGVGVGLSEHRLLNLPTKSQVLIDLGWSLRFASLKSSQVMPLLLVWEPHLENQ
jgi:hypothetical protein